MINSTVVEELGRLPEGTESEYHTHAAGLAVRLTAAQIVELEQLLASDIDRDVRFNALYVVLARHRRTLDASHYGRIYRAHASKFEDYPMRAVLDSDMALLNPAGPDLAEALRHARTALERMPGNRAITAHYARMLAEFAWNGGDVEREELEKAIHQLDRAIEVEPERPRFRAVRSQLSGLLGDYAAALAAIRRAIDLENSEQPDYAVRIIEYQRIQADVMVRRDLAGVHERLDRAMTQAEDRMREKISGATVEAEQRMNAEIGRLRSETLGSLGLLAAVIAFIVTTVQVANRQPVDDAMRMLVGIAGTLVLVFTAFGATFGIARGARLVLPGALGAALLIGAILL